MFHIRNDFQTMSKLLEAGTGTPECSHATDMTPKQ